MRTALYMGAMVASRFYPVIRDFYQRLLSAGKPEKPALTACMRKLLVILNTMLEHGSSWNHAAARSLAHSYGLSRQLLDTTPKAPGEVALRLPLEWLWGEDWLRPPGPPGRPGQ